MARVYLGTYAACCGYVELKPEEDVAPRPLAWVAGGPSDLAFYNFCICCSYFMNFICFLDRAVSSGSADF